VARCRRKSSMSPRKARHNRFLTIGRAVLLIAILASVGLMSAYLGIRMAVRGTEVQVPSLVNASVDEANKILEASSLKLEVVGQRYDPAVPAGAIISQHPGPAVRMKVNREVQAIVSLGKPVNPIPDLRGSTIREARLMIMQAGYEVGKISTVAVDRSSGEILQQYPAPGAREISSSRIDILLGGQSPVRYVMPDLLGEHISRAVPTLNSSGFQVGRIEYRSYQNVARGTVVKQFPEPGYPIRQGDSVNLEVSR
jgi:beta-lactam-binding protein with PASTA domain